MTIDELLARQMRERREKKGWRQEDLAAEAQGQGLPWTRDIVHAIENRRRKLTIGEFILLPLVFRDAAGKPIQRAAFFDSDEDVELTDTFAVRCRSLRTMFPDWDPESKRRSQQGPRLEAALHVRLIKKRIAAREDVTLSVAKKLGTDPAKIDKAAWKLYRRSVAAERDRRASAEPPLSPRSLRAKRGIITRQLIEELEKELKANVKGERKE